jgi:hypothetical protein
MFRHNLAEFDEIVRGRQRAGRHHQHGGETDRTVLHRCVEKFLHLGELLRRRTGVRGSHDALPQVVEAHVGGNVDRDTAFLNRVEIAAERLESRPAVRAHLPLVRSRGCAFTQHFGGDSLLDFARRVAIFQKQAVRMGVHVDKAGRDDEPAGVDFARGLRAHAPDRDDLVPADRNV